MWYPEGDTEHRTQSVTRKCRLLSSVMAACVQVTCHALPCSPLTQVLRCDPLPYIPIPGALGGGQRGEVVVGTSGDLQRVVPGRDVMGGGQDARSQPILWGDRARIHTCKEPNRCHWALAPR